MNNTIGNSIRMTLFGESHGKYIGAVIDGLPAGIPVREEEIAAALSARRPSGDISTSRREADEFILASGVFRGFTCGTPLCILIPNADTKSSDYSSMPARPGHADFTSHVRNAGFEDFRGGGHFSGRLTAAIVAACAVISSALEAKGIYTGTRILSIGDVSDIRFAGGADDVRSLKNDPFPLLDRTKEEQMKNVIAAAKADGDSVGGVLETAVFGVPAGCGDPWFSTVEGALSYALFSIPAVKGVEFGAGFELARMRGSDANDPFSVIDGKVVTATNNCGGVLGGMTTGSPIVFRTAIKPTPTISKEQNTVDLDKNEETVITAHGRHDPCIVHRAASVVNAMVSFTVADMLTKYFGEEYLRP